MKVTTITVLRTASLSLCYMLLLCGPLQSHNPGLHPWFRPCVLGVTSTQLSVAMPRPKHSECIPTGLQYLGPWSALLSHRYYVAVALGYLVCLYIGQPASRLCECVYHVDMHLSGLTSPSDPLDPDP